VIVYHDQQFLGEWLCDRIKLIPTPELRCIGRVRDGNLIGVVGYDAWNGSSCQMHYASNGERWINREFLFHAFWFPFNNGYKVLIGFVPGNNKKAIKLNQHLGFSKLAEIPDAHPDGKLILMTMSKDSCRWIKKGFPHGTI
jgi:hypothetical protein